MTTKFFSISRNNIDISIAKKHAEFGMFRIELYQRPLRSFHSAAHAFIASPIRSPVVLLREVAKKAINAGKRPRLD